MGFLDGEASGQTKFVKSDAIVIPQDYLEFIIVDNSDVGNVLAVYFTELKDSNEDYLSYVFEEEGGKKQQMIVNYYYKTDTIQIVDNWDDGKDYNGEYK